MDLTVFPAASLGLCFGFVAETVLITHRCFGCCLQSLKAASFSHAGVAKRMGGDTAGTAEPNWPGECSIQCHTQQ